MRLIFPTRFDNSPQSTPRAPIKIPMYCLEKKRVGRGEKGAEGPDIGLLILPAPIISRFLPSTKIFYDLAKHRTRVMGNPWPSNTGIWALVGAPAEWTEDATPEAGFSMVKKQPGMIGVGVVTKEYEQGGFDYLEFPAIYNADYEGPGSFAGCSGGGLWHMLSSKTEHGQRVIKDSVLSGVAFWECGRVDNKRIVICHGRRSNLSTIDRCAVRLTALSLSGRADHMNPLRPSSRWAVIVPRGKHSLHKETIVHLE